MPVRICTRFRGPLVVEGDIELFDENERRISTEGRSKILLCRCGATSAAPLCDGAHNRIGFGAPPEDADATIDETV